MTGPRTYPFPRFAPPYLEDPYPLYARAREEAGTFLAPELGLWLVTRYHDVRAALRDTAWLSSQSPIRTPQNPAPAVAAALAEGFPEVMMLLNEDPPDHTRTRAMVSRAFTPRRIATLTDQIQAIIERRLDALLGRPEADLIAGLAVPLPLEVICFLTGLPPEDKDQIKAWTQNQIVLTSATSTVEQQVDAARESVAFQRYLVAVAEERRAAPREDLISDVVAPPDGAGLSNVQVVSLLIMLLFAGHETSTNLIGGALHQLMRNPEAWAAVCADPSRAPDVVEEVMRLESPVQGLFRVARAGGELGGVAIPAGAPVFLLYAAANRDPAVFPDPDRLDIDRPNRAQHVGFGHGIHYCLGAPLARLEARAAIEALARRAPAMQLADGHPVPYIPNLMHRGPQQLWARWELERVRG